MAWCIDQLEAEPGATAFAEAPARTIDLTRREREIIALLCQRLTNREIAGQLFISPRTAGALVATLPARFGVSNRREAAIAVQQGLVQRGR